MFKLKRRLFIVGAVAALGGCAPVTNALNNAGAVHNVIDLAEPLDHGLIGTHGLAKLYPASAIDRNFPMNGFSTPMDATYLRWLRTGFAGYRLQVGGLVEKPLSLSLADLRRAATLSQITRLDCVEGWSVVGQWSGVPLAWLLAQVQPARAARYAVFHTLDRDDQGVPYYESLDLHQAMAPQTQLALGLNGKPLGPDYGAPVRLRIPTQLGYKSAKWVHRIELVASFDSIAGGNGGYWEDQGYEWYAGI
ncbi:MAG: molybdopterin-dependent oxidoreductase [Vulcanimicrobiaceae bacterium]